MSPPQRQLVNHASPHFGTLFLLLAVSSQCVLDCFHRLRPQRHGSFPRNRHSLTSQKQRCWSSSTYLNPLLLYRTIMITTLQLLYSQTSTTCILEPVYRSWDPVLDVYTTQSATSSRLVDSQFRQITLSAEPLVDYDPERFEYHSGNITAAIRGTSPISPGYIIATLEPRIDTGTNGGTVGGDSGAGTGNGTAGSSTQPGSSTTQSGPSSTQSSSSGDQSDSSAVPSAQSSFCAVLM
jgi:hypothetical protein